MNAIKVSDAIVSTVVDEQVVRFAHRYAWLTSVGFCAAAILLAFSYHQTWSGSALKQWLFLMLSSQLALTVIRWRLPKLKMSKRNHVHVLTVLALLEGALLSSCVLFSRQVGETNQMLTVVVLLAAMTSTVVSSAGDRRVFLSFSTPIVVSLLASLIFSAAYWQGNPVFYIVATVVALTTVFLFQLANEVFINIRDAQVANLHNKRTNQNLKAAVQNAKAANDSKTRFLATASHDLRQPINSLALFIASLQIQTESDEQKAIVASMTEAIKSIDGQLESLLDISKLDAGIVTVHSQSLELNNMIAQVVEPYRVQEDADVPIRFHPHTKSVHVKTDPALLERIVRNLLSNAIKYTPTGLIDVHLSESKGLIELSVEDTGIGISSENIRCVFDEFYQIDNPQREAARGLGLGLSIVQRLCELLEFRIALRSQPGVGSKFTLILPPAAPLQREDREPIEVKVERDYKRVLVLDNEDSILAAMRTVLERMGHYVQTYQRTEAALLGFAAAKFDVALVDYRMPGDNSGADVIRQFRRLDPRVRCYLVTGIR